MTTLGNLDRAAAIAWRLFGDDLDRLDRVLLALVREGAKGVTLSPKTSAKTL